MWALAETSWDCGIHVDIAGVRRGVAHQRSFDEVLDLDTHHRRRDPDLIVDRLDTNQEPDGVVSGLTLVLVCYLAREGYPARPLVFFEVPPTANGRPGV